MPKRVGEKNRERPRHFIRQWRKFRGLAIGEVANRLSTSKATVSRIENGLQPYTQDSLEALANALNTDPAALLAINPIADDAIWATWDEATPAQRKLIGALAKALLRFEVVSELPA